MTHNVHPYAHRIAILRGWKSRWFRDDQAYRDFLRSDVLLREYLEDRLKTFHVSTIEIERSEKTLRIILHTSRPGLIIGRSGQGIEQLLEDVKAFIKKERLATSDELKIDVEEIRSPESDAGVVAQQMRDALERRLPFRRILKQTADKVMANRNVKGVRITVAGRLGGAEMSRKEEIKKGQIPLQTFRADIDFARETAVLPYGSIGVKVWIYRGEIFDNE